MVLAFAVMAAHVFTIPADRGRINASLPAPIECRVDAPPRITVKVETDDIDYDYSRGARELGGIMMDTKTPFPPGGDTVTGGLRSDHPSVRTRMQWDIVYEENSNMGCMRYKSIDIDLHLRPKIFVAREFDRPGCREEVLGHERKHVRVDREVMNKYAEVIGRAVQDIVNRVGALGPFSMKDIEAVKKQSSGYITATMNRLEKEMMAELRARQQKVDSPEEYKRVGGYCKGVHVAE